MKCPQCSAENPDYSFYCGRCASELRGSAPKSPQAEVPTRREPTVESMVRKNLVRIEENTRKERRVLIRKVHLRGTISFRTDAELFTLDIDKDGHPSIIGGGVPKPVFELSGPYEAFSSMLGGPHIVGPLPDSITVSMVVPEHFQPTLDRIGEKLLREAVWKLLKSIFE